MTSQERLFKHRSAVSGEIEPLADFSSGFAWEAGYAFTWPATSATTGATGATGSMIAHSGHIGMSYAVGPNWEVSADVDGDIIPDQSYGHGHFGLRIETFVPLFSLPKEPEPKMPVIGNADQVNDPEDRLDPDEGPPGANPAPIVNAGEERDARAYYFKKRKRRQEVREDLRYRGRYRKKDEPDGMIAGKHGNSGPLVETGPRPTDSVYPHYDDDEEPPPPPPKKLPPEPLYPHLTIALILGADQHVRDLGAELSLTSPLSSGEEMSGLSVGGEVAYQHDAGTRFHVLGVVSSYSRKISTFLTGLPSAEALSFIMPSSVVAALQPHFLAFPGLLFEEGASHELNGKWRLGIALNQVVYAASGSGVGLGFAPAATYTITKRWSAGLGAGVCVGGPASGTVVGLLNVGYLF
jgi:hypothetical protein